MFACVRDRYILISMEKIKSNITYLDLAINLSQTNARVR